MLFIWISLNWAGPNIDSAVAVWLCRAALSQMDLPARDWFMEKALKVLYVQVLDPVHATCTQTRSSLQFYSSTSVCVYQTMNCTVLTSFAIRLQGDSFTRAKAAVAPARDLATIFGPLVTCALWSLWGPEPTFVVAGFSLVRRCFYSSAGYRALLLLNLLLV